MLGVLATAYWALTAASPLQTIREDDFARLVSVESPAIAPDGKHAVIVATRILWNDDKRAGDLVLVDLGTGAQQTLITNREGLSDPAFSPDGSRLAFLADEGTGKDALAQVFVMPAEGGDAKAVTRDKDGVEQFAWRPDSRALAYTAADPDPKQTGADRFRDSFVFTTEPIVAHELPKPVHLFTVSLIDGGVTQLTTGEQSVATGEAESTLSWSPDGKTIAFTLVPNAILNDESYSRVALVDVATHNLRTITGKTAWEGDPIFSPDGAWIAYSCAKGDSQVNLQQLCVTTPLGGAGRPISAPLDRPIAQAAWSSDSASLWVTVPDRSSVAFYRLPLRGAPVRLATNGLIVSSGFLNAVASNGTIVFVASSTKQPAELYVRDASGMIRSLTDFNDSIAALDLATAQRVTFPTTTGVTGDGILYFPPGFTAGNEISARRLSSTAVRRSVDARVRFLGASDGGARLARAAAELSRQRRISGWTISARFSTIPKTAPAKISWPRIDAVRARGIVDDFADRRLRLVVRRHHDGVDDLEVSLLERRRLGRVGQRLDHRLRHRRRQPRRRRPLPRLAVRRRQRRRVAARLGDLLRRRRHDAGADSLRRRRQSRSVRNVVDVLARAAR